MKKSKKSREIKMLELAIKTLQYYATTDYWFYKNVKSKKENGSPVHTSFELIGKDGKIKEGWKWAENTLEEMRNIEES